MKRVMIFLVAALTGLLWILLGPVVGPAAKPLPPAEAAPPAGYRIVEPVASWPIPSSCSVTDLGADSDNQIYYAMNCTVEKGRVLIVDSTGKLLKQFGEWGTGNGQFRNVQSAIPNKDNKIYVSDDLNQRIQIFSRMGSGSEMIITYESQFSVPTYPYHIAFNSSGDVLLGGYWSNNVYQYSPTGSLIRTFTGFSLPKAVAVDSKGYIYVVEHWADRVSKISASGERIFTIGSSGNGDCNLDHPTDIVIDEHDHLYVMDQFNSRVQVFSTNGACLGWYGKGNMTTGWHEPGSGERPQSGSELGAFNRAWALVLGPDGFLYVSDLNNYRIQKLRREATDGDGDGVPDTGDLCLGTPAGEAVDGNGCSDSQVDADGDGACDPEAPSAGPSGCSGIDNCPRDFNTDQADLDGDGQGDACDPDDDGDDVVDTADNCPRHPNPDQADLDGDGQGDACDPDDDGDGLADLIDRCPREHPGSADADGDGCIDRIADLPALIEALDLPADIEAALLDSAVAARESIARGQYRAARGQLGAFVNKVKAQRGKKIPEATAEMLLAYAANVMAALP